MHLKPSIGGLLLFSVIIFAGCEKKPEGPYPQRDISVYIFSSPGGGTDTWTRMLAEMMSKELGVGMVCSNLPGAKGGTGAMRVWNSKHYGYSLLGASETSVFFGINDVAPPVDQWRFFIAGGSPGAVAVHSDSPYTSIEMLAVAAKQRPGSVKVSNSGHGKLWHIKALFLEKALGATFKHVPYNGSGPALTALLSREVDMVSCSCSEMSEYVKAGLVRPLIVTDRTAMDFEGFGTVRSAVEVFPESEAQMATLSPWLGFMVPRDVDPERLEVLESAFLKVMASQPIEGFLKSEMARKIALCGEAADALVKEMQQVASWTAHDMGIARKSPEALGLQKPTDWK